MNNKITGVDDILNYEASDSTELLDDNDILLKLVIFELNNNWYAFYGSYIKEILPRDTLIFFVPGCPSSLNGVINLRGEIESVIDIRKLLQLSDEKKQLETILLAQTDQMKSAIVVDQVIDVIDVLQSEISDAPDNLDDNLKNYVSQAFSFKQRLVTILNIEKLFADYLKGLG